MTAIPPNTPPPRSLGSSEPPRASSEIHSAPTGARELDGQRLRNVPRGHAETIGSESLPAVGASVQRMMDWIAQSLVRGLEPKTPQELRDEAIAAAKRFVREATASGFIVPREYLDSDFVVTDDAVTVTVNLIPPPTHILLTMDMDTGHCTVTPA